MTRRSMTRPLFAAAAAAALAAAAGCGDTKSGDVKQPEGKFDLKQRPAPASPGGEAKKDKGKAAGGGVSEQ